MSRTDSSRIHGRCAEKWRTVWQKAIANARESLRFANSKLAFKYWKECRDLNHGSFHLVLASMLSSAGARERKPRSFVMDITRDDQIWNHPIYQFKSWMGEPTNLKEGNTTDPYKTWRAPGTKRIVDVHTIVAFGVENGPRVVYRNEDEAIRSMQLHDTLELDDKGIVIEWHQVAPSSVGGPKALSGEVLLKELRKLASSESSLGNFSHPDFIWGQQKMQPLRMDACYQPPF